MAQTAGLRCIGVKETDERHGRPDFEAEKRRAREKIHEPHVEQNLRLLDSICFIPFRRELHEIPSMLAEIVRQSTEAPLLPLAADRDDPARASPRHRA